MKLLTLLAFALMVLSARADQWGLPKPQNYRSPNGRFSLEVRPGDWQTKKKAIAVVQGPEVKRVFALLNAQSPVEACVTDSGEVFTLDDWGHVGYSLVVVWYSAEGQMKKEFTLKELVPAPQLEEIKRKYTSVSSIHWRWRAGAPIVKEGRLVVHDALGGCVTITNGTVEYLPLDQTKK